MSITLVPGWNWISYTNATSVGISEAFDGFVPVDGDIVKAKTTSSRYRNGRWTGGLTQFTPGFGYMYYSARTESVEFSFTHATLVSVETITPTDITLSSAVVGGNVTLSEGGHVFLRGVCWGTEPNPDIDGSHTSDGTGIDSFNNNLDGLNAGTTYYVRAYAVTEWGLAYGDEVSFNTLTPTIIDAPIGAINGLFTINSSGLQVYFSKGNLQY